MNRGLPALALVAGFVALGASPSFAQSCGANTKGDVPGVDKKAGVIKLGTVQPITGPAAQIGVGVAQGIEMAVQAVNAGGGIDGCKFEMVTLDDRLTLDVTVANVRRLIERDEVWSINSPTGSANLPATYQIISASGTPMWGPITPVDRDIQQIYLLAPTRTEQTRVCVDYFASKGAKTVASLSPNDDRGVEAAAAVAMQSKIDNLQVLATEKIDTTSPNVSAAVLNIINSKADALLITLQPGVLATALNALHDGGYKGILCSDGGSAGVGSLSNVGAANPAASDGFLAAAQTALPDTEDPFIDGWRKANASYSGKFKDGAAGYSLQGYAYTMALFDLVRRLKGDLSRENFHATAQALVKDPIKISAIPQVACGPLPGGHTCAKGASMVRFDSGPKKWVQLGPFTRPKE